MKIGIDVMGGDYAPMSGILGAVESLPYLEKETQIVLFGNGNMIEEIAKKENLDLSPFTIIHTTEVIEMEDHPAKAFTHKPDSSIAVGFSHLSQGKIDGFASAGNTGAMMVGTMYNIGVIEGITRPCISSLLPIITGQRGILADVGLNPDSKPENLNQYAILASVYAKEVLNIDSPRVALLNIGSEKEKGNNLTKAAYELMASTTKYNFVGNIEGYHIFTGKVADVIICDGFNGNVVLKMAEGFYKLSAKQGIESKFFSGLNYESHGGTPVLGVNAPVVIGHGSSTPIAIKNMILQTENAVRVGLVQKIKDALK